MKKQTAWEKKCEKAADDAGVKVLFFADIDISESDQYEDDGTLHVVRKGGQRASFLLEDMPAKKYNAKTIAIMTALGLAKKIGPRVLVDEAAFGEEPPITTTQQEIAKRRYARECFVTNETVLSMADVEEFVRGLSDAKLLNRLKLASLAVYSATLDRLESLAKGEKGAQS